MKKSNQSPEKSALCKKVIAIIERMEGLECIFEIQLAAEILKISVARNNKPLFYGSIIIIQNPIQLNLLVDTSISLSGKDADKDAIKYSSRVLFAMLKTLSTKESPIIINSNPQLEEIEIPKDLLDY